MKNKRLKGSITIVVILMMIFLITVGLVLYDFTKLSSSREDIERTLIKAMDSALVEYDEDIHEKYNLMAFKKEIDSRSIIEDRLNMSLNRKGVKADAGSLELLSLDSMEGGALSEEKAIKRAILRAHQKTFVANKVSEWIDKLEILEMIPEYSKAMKLYTKSIKVIAKLKDSFDDLRKKSQEILNRYHVVKRVDIKECINTIMDINDEIKSLEDDKSELIKEKNNLIQNAESYMDVKEEVDSIREDIKSIRDEIKEKNKEKDNLEEVINNVKDLVHKVEDYSSKLKTFAGDLSSKAGEIKKDMDNIDFGKNSQMGEVKKKIHELLTKVENHSTTVSEISEKIEKVAEDANKQIEKIDEHLNNGKRMMENIYIQLPSIDEISSEELKNTFGDINQGSSMVMGEVLDFIWDSIAGDYLPNFDELETIDSSSYANLPSNGKGFSVEKSEASKSKPITKKGMADSSLSLYEDESKKNVDSKIGTMGNEFFQKLIIADYAVETFCNINSDQKDLDASPIKAEVEYILSGNASAKENALITQGKIYALRMVLNGISILMHKQAEINEITTTLSSITGFLGYPIVYGLVSLGWSAVESAQDIKALNSGESVPIIKGPTEIKTDFKNIAVNMSMESFKKGIKERSKKVFTSSKKDAKGKKKGGSSKSDMDIKNPLSMDYKDHLILFLILEDETETLLRISDLICMKENVDTRNYYSVIQSKIRVKIPVIFLKAKREFDGLAKGSYIYEVEKVRGY